MSELVEVFGRGAIATVGTYRHDPSRPHDDPETERFDAPTIMMSTGGGWTLESAVDRTEVDPTMVVIASSPRSFRARHAARFPTDVTTYLEFGPLHPGGVDGEIAEVLAALEGRQSAPRTPGVTSAIAALAPRPDAPALRVDIAAAGLLLAIAEAVRPRAARVPTPLRAQVLVARDYLDEHFAEDVDLATLARVASVSPFHLARAFRAEVGIPPHAYLVERRLDRAAALLGSGDGTVTQVAMAVGFRSPAHFAKRFRRRFGTSPSAFRAD